MSELNNKDNKFVLVASHERSGTHFLIDSIVNNFTDTCFPTIRPSFSSLENLLLPHDTDVTKEFENFVYKNKAIIKIFKTHLLPEEIGDALENSNYFSNSLDREILEFIFKNSKILYIRRNVLDVMYSLYNYMKKGGGLQNTMSERIKNITPSQFIRMPNYRIMPIRSFREYDKNLITYWDYHIHQWMKREVFDLTYEDLSCNYSSTIKKISEGLEISEFMVSHVFKPKIQSRKSIIIRLLKKIFPNKKHFSSAVLPRKGIVNDGKSKFSDDDQKFIYENIIYNKSMYKNQ